MWKDGVMVCGGMVCGGMVCEEMVWRDGVMVCGVMVCGVMVCGVMVCGVMVWRKCVEGWCGGRCVWRDGVCRGIECVEGSNVSDGV